jgi:glycosyltransferase involved in cell wall biosynthesis
VLYIVTDYAGTYHLVVDRLRDDAGAELIELDPQGGTDRALSKLGILRRLVTPRLLRLRNRWTGDDVVLVMSWYLLPVLSLVKLRLLGAPLRLVSLGTFVHDRRLRQAVNVLLRALAVDQLEFIVFSDAERRNLVEAVGLSATRVHRVVYRGRRLDSAATRASGDGYVFTGGYSNRDYRTFFAAVRGLKGDVVAVASDLNDLGDPPTNVDLRKDVSWDEFEQLIRRCGVLVLPLEEGGEACGQSVLVRGIQHSRPVVATRHDSLVDYLGDDYAGFVPPRDPEAMRAAIERGLHDHAFRESLLARIEAASRTFDDRGQVEAQIARIVAPDGS